MSRVLIIFAHPTLEKSRVHRRLVEQVPRNEAFTLNDIYEAYPDFDIDVGREQDLLLGHDLIILQHPLFWYSVPPLLKQWIDLVLEHGWAYGSQGTALRGKSVTSLISTGGAEPAYQPGGYNHYTIRQLLAPIEQTFRLCGMEYLDPYVIHGTHRMNLDDIAVEAERYRQFLSALPGLASPASLATPPSPPSPPSPVTPPSPPPGPEEIVQSP
ncbi:MAG: NAD(P)H-dependent oxidoreductase [Rhodothermia bacterium]